MDISQIQAMNAYIQHLNLQTAVASNASLAASTTTTTPPTAAAPLLNPSLMNAAASSSSSTDANSLNSFALALLYANQASTPAAAAAPSVQQPQQQAFQQQPQVSIPLPSTFHQQQPLLQQQQTSIYTSSAQQQLQELQNQLEQQAILNQISQLISLGQNQNFQIPQIGNLFNPPPQQQPTVFQQQPQPQQQQHLNMSKPPILTPSQPIQIPRPHHQQSNSLTSSLNGVHEKVRKRRHRDIPNNSNQQRSSQSSSSQSQSPNNNIARSRAFTCPETMKPTNVAIKEEPRKNASPDKIAKFDPTCPQRHHPDNMSPPNRQAMMLEQLTHKYILNALGDVNSYKSKDENEIEKGYKVPVAAIHRLIEDCYNDI
jgi:hypothetical protein